MNALNELLSPLSHCQICPRECGADRIKGEWGYCRTDAGLNLSSICIHQGEEPAISGEKGICNVFFRHCNLQCRFCQNFQISDNQSECLAAGQDPEAALGQIEGYLRTGISLVGFVSPSHVLPQMRWLIQCLRERGHHPVFVMNTNAYDKPEALADLADEIGVYLPDLKYMDSELAGRYSDAPDYPRVAQAAIKEMFRQKGAVCTFRQDGLIESGLIIRHLVLPGQIENTLQCLRWIASELSPEVYLSLMSQYTPIPRVAEDPMLGRCLQAEEYGRVVEEMDRLGMENGWMQSLDSARHYFPDFKKAQPFEG